MLSSKCWDIPRAPAAHPDKAAGRERPSAALTDRSPKLLSACFPAPLQMPRKSVETAQLGLSSALFFDQISSLETGSIFLNMWFRNVLFQRTLSNGVRPNIGFVVKRAK